MASFNTVDKLGDENQTPLVSGIFVDLGAELYKDEAIIKAVRAFTNSNDDLKKTFRPPFLVMDLAAPEDVPIEGEASYPPSDADDSLVSDDYELNPNVKLLVPAKQVVDISNIGAGTTLGANMRIKVNQMIPAYRWFQAANLLLQYEGLKTRVVPFPLDHDQGTTYHMLPVSPSEFQLSQELLDHSVNQLGLQKGFETAAKFTYELLGKRGITELNEQQVDKLLIHVMLGNNEGVCQGVLFHRAAKSDFEEVRKSHFIYY